jgi:hypothetical protein
MSKLKAQMNFEDIIIECQELRKKFGVYYEEECKEQIDSFSNTIIENNLIESQTDKTFAKQLCMANSLKYES